MDRRGGYRPGSGRKKGVKDKMTIASFLTDEQKEEMTMLYFEKAKEDKQVLTHLIDQIFGKAKQSMNHSGELEFRLSRLFDEALDKNKD